MSNNDSKPAGLRTWIIGAVFVALIGVFAYLAFFKQKGRSGLLPKGEAAAHFKLPKLNSRDYVSVRGLKGKPVVLNFWALYCPPCKREMPDLEALYKEFKPKGLVILGINTDDPRDRTRLKRVSAFVKQKGLTFPILMDYYVALKRYKVTRIPYTVLIDRQGRIVNDYEGPRSRGFFRKQFSALVGSTQ